jgi:hypothetical protein
MTLRQVPAEMKRLPVLNEEKALQLCGTRDSFGWNFFTKIIKSHAGADVFLPERRHSLVHMQLQVFHHQGGKR